MVHNGPSVLTSLKIISPSDKLLAMMSFYLFSEEKIYNQPKLFLCPVRKYTIFVLIH